MDGVLRAVRAGAGASDESSADESSATGAAAADGGDGDADADGDRGVPTTYRVWKQQYMKKTKRWIYNVYVIEPSGQAVQLNGFLENEVRSCGGHGGVRSRRREVGCVTSAAV